MISFNHLGNLGRLGNQMFQYAALKGIAANRKFEFLVPPRDVFGLQDAKVRGSLQIYDLFNLSGKRSLTNFPMLRERQFGFLEDLYNFCPENIDLYGYFQTEKYFEAIKNQVLSDFTFSVDVMKKCKDMMKEEKYISLHIRRGDYKELSHVHPLQPICYYEKALGHLDRTIPVLVFSDDIDWCISQNIFQNDRFIFQKNDAHIDMCMMSLCDYHIIANSSFSWWGAYLSKSRGVVAPKNWFTVESKIDYKDIYCEGWHLL